MIHADFEDRRLEEPVLELIRRERQMALSPREWKFRLAGYGYAIRDTDAGQMVMSLAHGTDLGVLPVNLA